MTQTQELHAKHIQNDGFGNFQRERIHKIIYACMLQS